MAIITVYTPDVKQKRLKRIAKNRDMSLNNLINEALEAVIEDDNKRVAKKRETEADKQYAR